MEFLNELGNSFVIVLLVVVVLLALFFILFYPTPKEFKSKSIVTVPLTYINSFFELRKKKIKEKKDSIEEKEHRNRLYLLYLLNKDAIDIKKFNEDYEPEIKEIIREPLTIHIIHEIIIGNCKFVSTRLYKLFFNSLNEGQIVELGRVDRFLYNIGLNVKKDNFYKELAPLLDKMTFSELFDKVTKIKKVTGRSYKQSYYLLKTRRAEYLRGILDFGFSEDQMDSVERMREKHDMYDKKNTEEISPNDNQELSNLKYDNQDINFGEFARENKKIPEYISSEKKILQKSDKNKVNEKPDQDNLSFELPLSESRNMEEFTKKTLRRSKTHSALINSNKIDNNTKVKSKKALLKEKKQSKKSSKR